MKKIIIIFFSLISTVVMAKEINVDMFGADPQLTERILKKYGTQVMNLTNDMQQNLRTNSSDGINKVYEQKLRLIDEIKKEGNFLHTDIQTIIYSKKEIFTTIEVIKKEDKERLSYITANSSSRALTPSTPKNKDVVDEMMNYSSIGFNLFTQENFIPDNKCPVYHCFLGFTHPKLRPFLKIFSQGIINKKALVLNTLAKDTNPDRREAAVLLVGHLNDPKEIIQILLPYINDKNEGVRNNAMRVIGSTMTAAKLYDIDIKPFIALLDSPVNTDRNKALYILSQAIKLKKNKFQVARCAKDKLPALLALKQPNNHDLAYIILKDLSKKDFGPTHVSAWKKWLDSNPYPVKCLS